jgi:hypothetical protein
VICRQCERTLYPSEHRQHGIAFPWTIRTCSGAQADACGMSLLTRLRRWCERSRPKRPTMLPPGVIERTKGARPFPVGQDGLASLASPSSTVDEDAFGWETLRVQLARALPRTRRRLESLRSRPAGSDLRRPASSSEERRRRRLPSETKAGHLHRDSTR